MKEERRRTAAVLTVSDRCSRGEREDRAGPLTVRLLEDEGLRVVYHQVLPDDKERIARELRRLLAEEKPRLIVTTGGTGFAPRDVTPEATLPFIERRTPGIEESLRRAGAEKGVASALLGRGVSGLAGQTWIINLPGSVGAVRDGFEVIRSVLHHALDELEGRASHD